MMSLSKDNKTETFIKPICLQKVVKINMVSQRQKYMEEFLTESIVGKMFTYVGPNNKSFTYRVDYVLTGYNSENRSLSLTIKGIMANGQPTFLDAGNLPAQREATREEIKIYEGSRRINSLPKLRGFPQGTR